MTSLELDRERAIQTLCAHYANDHLTTQELETRFDLAYKATTSPELVALVASLPALPPTVTSSAFDQSEGMYHVMAGGEAAPEKRIMALMSEVKKHGEWIPAQRNVVRAVMGSVLLDLREALLSPGVTELEITAIMGEVKVIVPPGVAVTCDGTAIMGEFKEVHSSGDGSPHTPTVRIHGMAFMGAVSVKTRLPGESSLAAWRRVQRERRLKNR